MATRIRRSSRCRSTRAPGSTRTTTARRPRPRAASSTILVVALQPWLDRVQFLGARTGHGREVLAAHFEAGGPGVVAARLLRAIPKPAKLIGLAAGATGDVLRGALEAEHVDAELMPLPAPTPMRVVQHAWDENGELVSEVFAEHESPVGDRELHRVRDAFEAALGSAGGVVLCADHSAPSTDFLWGALVEQCRAAGVPVAVDAVGSALGEVAASGPTFLVAGAAADEALRRRFLGAGGTALVLAGGGDLVQLETEAGTTWIQPPQASDRGGARPHEALAAGMLAKHVEGWDLRPAVCYGVGAAAAQRQKEVGGRLAASDVFGFYSQVRVV